MSGQVFDFGAGAVPAHRHAHGGGWVADTATVSEWVWVGPYAKVAGGTIRGGAYITRTADCLAIGPLGSRDDLLTVYPDKDGNPLVCTGCFEGTPDAFVTAVRQTHGTSQTADEYTTAVTFLLGLWAARREVES